MEGKKFLIDVTDARFRIPVNDDIIAFIARANPFAHSDVGSELITLGKAIPGAEFYCPSFRSLAYVVLHTAAHRVFAIAFGQQGLAFRLDPAAVSDAVADGGTLEPEIGPDWVRFAPWGAGARERLDRWSVQAFTAATTE